MTDYYPEEFAAPAAQGRPHSKEAEEAVVGAVLINPEVYYDLAAFLVTDDFYLQSNRWVWEAFTRLHETRTPIDLLTLTEDLESAGHLANLGGAAYLTSLINQVPTSLNAEAYGRIVEENAMRRKMLDAASRIANLAVQGDTIDNVVGEAEKAVFGVSERRAKGDVEPIRKVLSEYYDQVSELAKLGADFQGVPTGFVDLDKLLRGLHPSDLLIVAGRPGQGKTGFLLSIAREAGLTNKKHVAIFSLEMSNEQVVQRLIAQQTGISSQNLSAGKLEENEWELFAHAIEVFNDTQIFLDDTPALTPLQLRTKCRRLHLEYKLDLIIIDYLQLMSGDRRNDNRAQEVSQISRNLKVLARELNVPVLAAAQLSRAVEQRADKRPILSDLRESGCLTGETLIHLPNDERTPIRELVGQTDFFVLGLNQTTQKIEALRVSRAFANGVKPVYKMKTRSGAEIRATGNHQFLTMDGWKRLDALRIENDSLAIPRTVDLTSNARTTLAIETQGAICAQTVALQALAESDIEWDAIVSIERNGEEEVFDLTVPEQHNFLANDIIVHNSLEQDADIVMFIHRPDEYEKDGDKANITKISVAKHRNGPTGEIDLIFRGNLTRFDNAVTKAFRPNE